MSLTLVSGPDAEPIALADAKRHLKVDVDDENDLIVSLIRAAREQVETYTGRRLIFQTWEDKRGFPRGPLVLPFSPVSAVSSITYLDTAGVSQTWSPALYRTFLPAGPQAARAWVEPAHGQSYPATYPVTDPVTVRVVCGYGASGASVPAGLIAAMKLLIGHWYQERSAVNIGNIVTPLPMGVESLVWSYRLF